MTTYPELMEILSETLTTDVYNQISQWHSERIKEANGTIFQYEHALWKIRGSVPKPDEQGGYAPEELARLAVRLIEIFKSMGKHWEIK